jgi:glycosyltransferase involved in cell wall biosynthesis
MEDIILLYKVVLFPYPFVEVIVVDDSSIDNTKAVCFEYPKVKYVYQSNSGLSAAKILA